MNGYEPWMDDALCAQVGGDFWFPPKGGSSPRAKAICAKCPVVDECREYAVRNFIREGIWGNTSRTDRRAIWKERRMTPPAEEEDVA